MARELPIRNGRLTTDLDADGHRIKNLPGGETFEQEQADWNQSDSTKPDFIKNKPTIPAPVTVDSALSTTSENPVQNKVVKAAVDSKCTAAEATAAVVALGDWQWTGPGTWIASGEELPLASESEVGDIYFWTSNLEWIDSTPGAEHWDVQINGAILVSEGGGEPDWSITQGWGQDHAHGENSDVIVFESSDFPFGDATFTARKRNVHGLARLADLPTKTSDLTNDSGFLTSHQSLAGLMPKYTFSAVQTVSSAGTEQSPNEVVLADAQNKRVSVTAAGAYISVAALATASDGIIRDMMLTLDCSSLSEGDEPTVSWGTHYHPRTDTATDLAIVEAGKRAVFYISEYASGEFAVGGWVETEGGSGT